jgi:hypothetical protein
MTAFLKALAWVSRFEFAASGTGVQEGMPRREQIVLARSAMALVIAAAASLLAWFVGERLVSAFCGAALAWGLRVYLPGDRERNGALLLYARLRSLRHSDEMVAEAYDDALRNVLIFLQPLCYFLLIYRGFGLWLLPAMCLATVMTLDLLGDKKTRNDGQLLPSYWLTAGVIVLLVCGFASQILPGQPGCFVLGVFGLILAWLLLPMITKYWPKDGFRSEMEARSAYYYLGEICMLLLGLLGIAL